MQADPHHSYNMTFYKSDPKQYYTYSESFQTNCSEWFVDLWTDSFHIVKRSIWDEQERKQGRRSKPHRRVEDDDLPVLYEVTIPRAAIIAVDSEEHLVTKYGTDYTMGSIFLTVTEAAADPRELDPCKLVEYPVYDKGYWDSEESKLIGAKGTIDAFAKLPTGNATKICIFQQIFARNPGDYWLSHAEDNVVYKGFQELGHALNWGITGKDAAGVWELG